MTKTFEAGKTYQTRSICDSNCIISVTVVSRTAQFLKTLVGGKPKTLRVGSYQIDGAEFVKPWGSYSMAPIVTAAD